MLVSKLRGGAMGASGIARPEEKVTQALTAALAAEAAGAQQWTVTAQTASILRELPTPTNADNQPNLYRLVLSCNPATRQGDIQLSWAPNAANGTLVAALDDKATESYAVEGTESMGDGQAAKALRAAVKLRAVMPAKSLTVSNLFPNQKVVFPFDTLPEGVRQRLNACFKSATAAVQ